MRTLPLLGTLGAALLAVSGIVPHAAIKPTLPQTLPILISMDGVLAVAPSGQTLASSGSQSDTVDLYNMHTGRTQTLRLPGGKYNPANYFMSTYSVAFSPDGQTLVNGGTAVDGAAGEKGSLNMWEVRTGKHLRLFAQGGVKGPAVVFSPDGKVVASSGQDGTIPRAKFGRQIRFWSAATGLPTGLIHTPSLITALAFSPDGKEIASGGMIPDPFVRVWNVQSHQLVWAKHLPSRQSLVTAMQFSPDGSLLATGSQGHIACLWDTRHGKLVGQLTAASKSSQHMAYEDVASKVAFSPNGKLLATGGISGVNVWSVATRKQTRALNAEAPMAFLPDGKHLLTVQMSQMGRNRVQVWALP